MSFPIEIINKAKYMAAYCYTCNACNSVCPTHLIGTFSPRTFLYKIVNVKPENFDDAIKNAHLFNCLTCQQCSFYCPMSSEKEGINFAELIQQLRTYGFEHHLLDNELETQKTHDNLLQIVPKQQADKTESINSVDFLKNDPSIKTTEKGEIALFVGCAQVLENILYGYNIKYTDIPKNAIKLLNKCEITPVVLSLKCCGHDLYWAGDVKSAKKLAEYNVNQLHQAGVKTVVLECAEGYRMWKYDYPKLVEGFNFEVKHLSEILSGKNIIAKLRPRAPAPIKVTYHDPCRMGRLGGGFYDIPRNLLTKIKQVELVEMKSNRQDALCCGVSIFKSCNSTTRRIRQLRIKEAIDTGAEYLITTCPKCITHFQCHLNETDDQGKPANQEYNINIVDFATFMSRMLE